MNRIRKISLAFLLLQAILFPIYSATTTIPELKYKLYFDKSPKNTFYFSDPLNPTVEYSSSSTGGGIQFSIPNENATGSPSEAAIGIYYNLESKATLKVWFNSARECTDAFRLKVNDGTTVAYLNFLVGIGDNLNLAKADISNATSLEFDGGARDEKAMDPVLTINANIDAPAGDPPHGTYYVNKGSKVLYMLIKAPKNLSGKYSNYMGGQYKGYIIMELTTF